MMGRVILVTGGSRSGKSVLAEKKAEQLGGGDILYIATAIPTDDDMRERIRIHQARRNPLWETYEGYLGLDKVILETEKKVILLDCITVLITNILFEDLERDFDMISKEEIHQLEERCIEEVLRAAKAARESHKILIAVTNEVGMSVVPSYRLGRIFSDITGRVNQKLANISDEVYMSVSGIPLMLKPRLEAVIDMDEALSCPQGYKVR